MLENKDLSTFHTYIRKSGTQLCESVTKNYLTANSKGQLASVLLLHEHYSFTFAAPGENMGRKLSSGMTIISASRQIYQPRIQGTFMLDR